MTQLTEEEIRDIGAVMAESFNRRAAAVGALRAVQARRGYISDEALRGIAKQLGLTPAELEGLATFYSLIFRRPVGRRVLLVCDSVACWALGSASLLQTLEQRLGIKAGETTPDGAFTLLRICCLGACDGAPAMMVDDRLVTNVSPETLDRILAGESPEGES